MTVRKLWDRLIDYPGVLFYYDSEKNEQDKIVDPVDMYIFVDENAEKQLLNYSISMEDNMVWIEF